MSLHIKTFQVTSHTDTLFVDLQYGVLTKGFGVRARITRRKLGGKEKLVGFAELNKGAEICNYPMDELSDTERDDIERQIKTAISD